MRLWGYLTAAALLGAAVLPACTTPPKGGPGLAGPPHRQQPAPAPLTCEPPTVLSRIDPLQQPTGIQVAELEGERECPDAPSDRGKWLVRKLFAARGKTVCQYLWQPLRDSEPDLGALENLKPVTDPPLLGGLTAMDDADHHKALHELARARFDFPQTPFFPPGDNGLVRVAILDSAATKISGEPVDPLGHGIAMTQVIRELACDQPPGDTAPACSVQFRWYPTLQLTIEKSQLLLPGSGAGWIGTAGILAGNIYAATDDWLREPSSRARAPLIINLSLGWSGCYGELDKMVREAIEYATCNGALVVAAGGNADVVDGCPTLPARTTPATPLHMLPGLWAGEKMDPDTCTARGVPPRITQPTPLLLGIGAVDYRDYQLSFTDHESDLVAYGQAVPTQSSLTPSQWKQASGTSLSAAAASGMAARILRYRPKIDASALTQLLFKTAVDLGPADAKQANFICNQTFAGGCSQPGVRRLSLCGILHEVARAECKPLEAHALSDIPELKPIVPDLTDGLVLGEPFRCPSCAPGACPAGCEWGASDGNWDARDKPWAQGQNPGGHCTCGMASCDDFTSSRRTLVAVALSAAPGFSLQIKFAIDVTDMRLVLRKTDHTTIIYVLGGALANELKQWNFSLPDIATAKVEFRRADGTLEVTDVRVVPGQLATGPAR